MGDSVFGTSQKKRIFLGMRFSILFIQRLLP